MHKSNKFFRYVWRINALLILLAAGALALLAGTFATQELKSIFARGREVTEAVRVGGPNDRGLKLTLSRATFVDGTDVLRAELRSLGEEGKYSSGDSSELRNLLYIEPGQKTGRWLLPDNEHVISDISDLKNEKEGDKKQVVATVVLVKASEGPSEVSHGRAMVFDPAAKKISVIGERVKEIQIASLSGTEITIVYEREQRLVRASFDSKTLAKISEQEIEIPVIK